VTTATGRQGGAPAPTLVAVAKSQLSNAAIADALEELGDLYELDGANVHRVLAYRTAAKAVRNASVSVAALAREGRASDLPGIGSTLQEKISTLIETGSIPAAEKLRAKFGADVAFGICREGLDAVTYLKSLAAQGADCDWREAGCFFGAHTERHFRLMARDAENQPRGLEQRIAQRLEEIRARRKPTSEPSP